TPCRRERATPSDSAAVSTGCGTDGRRPCPTSRTSATRCAGGHMRLGETAPDLSLPDTDGRDHALRGQGITVVVFTCNHCPYALAWHDRLLAVARDYADRGVRMVAVNPNDADRYPADSYEAMKERVASDGGWPLPYLRDESQEAARAFDAKTTPDVFV